MKKKIIITIVCILAAWIAVGAIDFVMVQTWHKPIFCIGRELAQDGGSGNYVGLGYSEREGNVVDGKYVWKLDALLHVNVERKGLPVDVKSMALVD